MNVLKGNLLFDETRGDLPGDSHNKYKKEI